MLGSSISVERPDRLCCVSMHAKQSITNLSLERLLAARHDGDISLDKLVKYKSEIHHHKKSGFSLISRKKIQKSLRLKRLDLLLGRVTNLLVRLKESSIDSNGFKSPKANPNSQNFYSLEKFEAFFGNIFSVGVDTRVFEKPSSAGEEACLVIQDI